MTVLSGLPRPLAIGVVLAIAAVVGAAGLCHVGVLAPQFATTGGGGSGIGPLQAPPGVPPQDVPPMIQAAITASQNTPHFDWSILENVSWRAWEVTAVDVPRETGLAVVAFMEPTMPMAGDYLAALAAAAIDPTLTRLPLTVPRGGHLVVFAIRQPGACSAPGSSFGHGDRVRPAVHVSTPFGERSVYSTQWIEAAPPCPA